MESDPVGQNGMREGVRLIWPRIAPEEKCNADQKQARDCRGHLTGVRAQLFKVNSIGQSPASLHPKSSAKHQEVVAQNRSAEQRAPAFPPTNAMMRADMFMCAFLLEVSAEKKPGSRKKAWKQVLVRGFSP